MDTEISVVILCYRAGQRVYNFVDRVIRLLESSAPSWEVVLVGNYLENSNDETPYIVKKIPSMRKNVKAVVLPKQGMMGWDARSGLREAAGRFICLIDGDEQMPPEDIIRVYKKIKEENLDFVKTYRVKRNDNIMRRITSCVYNFIFRVLFPRIGLNDINSKPKIFTKEAYGRLHLISDDWFLDAEMVIQARKAKFKMGEVPTEFFRCEYRKSFVKFQTIFEFIKNLFFARTREYFK